MQIGDAIEQALSFSRFGLCLLVHTQAALDYLVSLPAVHKALIERRLVLFDEKIYTQDNCISYIEAAAHPRLMCIGARKGALWSDTMMDAYRSRARAFFVPREELLVLYGKLPAVLSDKPRQMEDVILRLGCDADKAAFALRVFAELNLLDIDNSDKILALNNNGPRRELRQSLCFKGFEDIINE